MAEESNSTGSHLAGVEISIADAEKRKKAGEFIAEPFIAYNVITKVKDKVRGFDSSEYYVWRRYTEFELLRNYFVTAYPNVVIPPMPTKRGNASWTTVVDNFDPEFIEIRRLALQSFLRRVAHHPALSADDTFHGFLQQEAWSTSTTQFADKVEEKMKSLTASIKLKNQDSRFVDVKNYADNLSQNVSSLVKIHEKMVKHFHDIHEEYGHSGPVFSEWAVLEKDIGDVLQSTGHFMDSLATSVNDKLTVEEDQFAAPLREYALYADSLRTVVKRQELKQYELDKAEEFLNSKVASLEELQALQNGEPAPSGGKFTFKKLSSKLFGPDTPEVREEKMRKLEQEIEDGKRNLETLQQDLKTFSDLALQDIALFHQTKVKDFKKLLVQYAKTQIQFYKKSLQSWENMRSVVEGIN